VLPAEGGEAKEAADGEAKEAAGSGGEAEAVLRAVLAAADAEEVSCEEDSALLDRLGQLDLLLTWLWRVHGIDYYGGKELLLEADYEARNSKQRTIRGPRPEEGEEQDEDEGECRSRLTVEAVHTCAILHGLLLPHDAAAVLGQLEYQ
jgi:hypothetical protein